MFRNRVDTIEVGEGGHSFGYPVDSVLGDDTRAVLEQDVEWLIDELSELRVAWAKRLPECPVHPGSHPLDLAVTDSTIAAICPVTSEQIRARPTDSLEERSLASARLAEGCRPTDGLA